MLHTFASHRISSRSHTLWLILARLVLVLVVTVILGLLVGIVWVCVLAAIVGGQ